VGLRYLERVVGIFKATDLKGQRSDGLHMGDEFGKQWPSSKKTFFFLSSTRV
jgi:hypothetical protein